MKLRIEQTLKLATRELRLGPKLAILIWDTFLPVFRENNFRGFNQDSNNDWVFQDFVVTPPNDQFAIVFGYDVVP